MKNLSKKPITDITHTSKVKISGKEQPGMFRRHTRKIHMNCDDPETQAEATKLMKESMARVKGS